MLKDGDQSKLRELLDNDMFQSIGEESSPSAKACLYDVDNSKKDERMNQTEKPRRKVKEDLNTEGQEYGPIQEMSSEDRSHRVKQKRNSKSVKSLVEPNEQNIRDNLHNSEPEFENF